MSFKNNCRRTDQQLPGSSFSSSRLFACHPGKGGKEHQKYFDLKNYFTEQAGLLNAQKTGMEKTLTEGDRKQSKVFETVDWKAELQSFMETDMNKPAWKNSFTCDSVLKDSVCVVTYTSAEDFVPVKKVVITEENDTIKKIFIESEKKNKFYSAQVWMEYFPLQGYPREYAAEGFLSDAKAF